MIAALTVLHVLVCIFLIAVVLLQRGKGAEMGAVFGGGASSTVFGSRGAGNFLTLLTKICAAVFMLTSLTLSYLYTERAGEQLFENGVETSQQKPATEQQPVTDLGKVAPEPTGQKAAGADAMDGSGGAAAAEKPAGSDAQQPDTSN
jgi:preprotein translocase subunit SecG